MNEMRRPIREADEIVTIRNIVMRHQFPSFLAGFDVLLDTVDDDPAARIVFTVEGSRPHSLEARKARADVLNNLVSAIHDHLREEVPNRYPYFRFHDSAPNPAQEN